MALQDELLSQARRLVTTDGGIPLQADLRRAISSAYYAVFHLLIAESVALLVPERPPGMRAGVTRTYGHSDMDKGCGRFAKSQLGGELQLLLPGGVPAELRSVAVTFSQLLQQRHSADYDISFSTDRARALTRIKEAENAFSAWNVVKGTSEAEAFLTALAFPKSWSK